MKLPTIKSEQILPLILIIINFAASAVCFYQKDIRKGIYWFAAGVLNAAVTF